MPAPSPTLVAPTVDEVSEIECLRQTRGRRARPIRLTDRDRELLRFIAGQRFILAAHAQAFLDAPRVVTYRRLLALVDAGLLSYRRIFHAEPGCYQITNGGLAVIDSPLPKAKIDLRTYRHDVGATWLWTHSQHHRYGPAERVFSERELRSLDERLDHELGTERFGVETGGYDRAGRPALHHPDVLVLASDERGVALELELSVKARSRLESILLGYAHCPRVHRVVYVTDSGAVNRVLRDTVASFGLDGVVQVLYVSNPDRDGQWWLWRSLNDKKVVAG